MAHSAGTWQTQKLTLAHFYSRWSFSLRSKQVVLFVTLPVLSGVLFLLGTLHLPSEALAAAHHAQYAFTSGKAVDAVVVLDNVSQIGPHDPNNDRFAAASLFVDLASANDRIGTVEISSSTDPANGPGYHPLVNMTKTNKGNLKQIFSAEARAGIDQNPTAYFTPALNVAGDMLKADRGNTQRYLILVTDTLAESGDMNYCPDPQAKQYYKWYCAVRDLEQQGISVELLAFFGPTSDPAEFQPTHDYIVQHGGSARSFGGEANLAQALATQYIDIFSGIHQNIFVADVNNAPAKIDVDRSMGNILSSITFVALGAGNVSVQLQNPSHTLVTGMNTGDSYNSTGSIYWLQTIATGRLDGEWQLTYSNSLPSDVLVIAQTNAQMALLNPVSSTSSDISVRYVPAGTTILNARLIDDNGQPLTGIPTAIVTPICCTTFASVDIPPLVDSDPGDISAVATFPEQEQDYTLGIGIGKPVQPGIYLVKHFTFHTSTSLHTIEVAVPQGSKDIPLDKDTGIPVSANGVNNTGMGNSLLTLFDRAPGGKWQEFAKAASQNGEAAVAGTFPLDQGCGTLYDVAVVEKITGTLDGKSYAYYSYDTKSYAGYLKAILTGNVSFVSSTDLSWWGKSRATWKMLLTSTVCSNDTLTALLNLTLKGKNSNAPQVSLEYGRHYSVVSPGVVSIAVPHDTNNEEVLLSAVVGACTGSIPLPALLPPDHTATFTLKVQSMGQEIPLQLTGDIQKDVTCPWLGTLVIHNLTASGLIFVCLAIFARHFRSLVRLRSRKPYLVGAVQFITNSPDLSEPDTSFPPPNSAEISAESRLSTWYLEYRSDETSDGSYVFTPQWTSGSLIRYSIGIDEESRSRVVVIAATVNAVGEKIPQFEETNTWLRPMEEYICSGKYVRIGNDILIPDVDISL